MIRASDRVATVLARDERLVEIFVRASERFETLRKPALRKTMARLVTVEQAARIARIDAGVLVDQLNRALGEQPAKEPPKHAAATVEAVAPIPEAWRALAAEQRVDLDVRDDLRAGREPFQRIFVTAREIPEGGVLRLRAIFEPAPLYAVLGKQGFTHATEQLAADDWQVWFRRESVRGPARVSTPASSEMPSDLGDEVVILDVRGLEPPEPMERTLEALSTLPRGQTLVQLNVRVPRFLLPHLEERGFTYEVREQSADLVRLFIRHAN